jgi:site-specific DNA-methyltransferase (adenine-specific)
MRELNYIDETIERDENPALRIGSVGRSALSTVYLMDCIEGMKRYPDKYFDLAVVDPPYGINADVTQNDLGGKKGFTKNAGTYKKYHKTNWDNEIPSDEYFAELKRVSKNQIVWGGNYFHNLHLEGVIVWYKKGSGNFKEGEFAKTSINTFKVFGYSRADAYINCGDVKIHPTQKPVVLYEWIFKNYARDGDKILDTHLGSGSSRIAANKAGLDFVGFEIDREYFDNGNKRFKNFVSQTVLF